MNSNQLAPNSNDSLTHTELERPEEQLRLISPSQTALFASLFSALTLGGLVGNGLVIGAVASERRMRRSAMNVLLLNLAVADLLNLVATSAEWTQSLWAGHPCWWALPAWTCPVLRYTECVFLFASILTQLAVFVAICFPLHARRLCTRPFALLSLLAVWLAVLVFALPNVLFNEMLQIDASRALCLNPYSLTEFWLAYKWAEFLAMFLSPALLCALLHWRLCVALSSPPHHLRHSPSGPGEKQKQPAEHLLVVPGVAAVEEALRLRRRVVRMLMGCVAVQLTCYSPIQAMFLATALFDVVLVPPYWVLMLLNALALACSAANPLLYTLFSRNFRTRTRKMLLSTAAATTPNCLPSSKGIEGPK